MTDKEYDILDKLYFLTNFKDLQENAAVKSPQLEQILWELVTKEWALSHKNGDVEITPTKSEFESEFGNYHYLASKKGLLDC